MAGVVRVGDTVTGYFNEEHHNHYTRDLLGYDDNGNPIYSDWYPLHPNGSISGSVLTGSSNVFVNGKPLSGIGDKTNETDKCCSYKGVTMNGTISGGSSKVFVNGKGVARNGDAVTPHTSGYASINSGSSNVFVD